MIIRPTNRGVYKNIGPIQEMLSNIEIPIDANCIPLFDTNDKVFSIADEIKDGKPVFLINNNEKIEAIPDDRCKAVSWFYQLDTIQYNGSFTYPIELIIWYDKNKFDRTAPYQIKQFVINEVAKGLKNLLLSQQIAITTDWKQVFTDFSYGSKNTDNSFEAIRFSFDIEVNLDCDITIDSTGFPYTFDFKLS